MSPQGHPMGSPPPALTDAAFARLRTDLIEGGRLTRRSRLVTSELAHQLRMSRTPIREALDRLAVLGYLTPLQTGGYERRRYRTRDVRDIYELRSLLEPVAAELAAGVSAAIAPVEGPAFHARVARAAGNDSLAQTVELLLERVAAVRIGAGTWRAIGYPPSDAARPAHTVLARAIERGDRDAARRTMARHLAAELRLVLRERAAVHRDARHEWTER